MSVTAQTITKAQFTAILNLGGVAPVSEVLTYALPLNFNNVQNVQLLNGTFTPNDDYIYLLQAIVASLAPTFMIIVCDSPMALTCTFPNGSQSWSINRFALMSWNEDPANLMTGMYIDGRTGPNPYVLPMQQGQQCNYTIIVGQSQLS